MVIEVFKLEIPENISFNELDKLMQYTDKEKQAKIKRFVIAEDKKRALLAEVLKRAVICDTLKVNNDEIDFEYNKHGKPCLKHKPDFNFNISHSGKWIVCAMDCMPLGIDVEQIKPIDFDIVRRFFSKEECEYFSACEENSKLSLFYSLWTLKESYIKAYGKGLAIPLASFTIKLTGDGISIKTEHEFNNCFFRQYCIDSNYKLAVCALNDKFPQHILSLSIEDICSMLSGNIV